MYFTPQTVLNEKSSQLCNKIAEPPAVATNRMPAGVARLACKRRSLIMCALKRGAVAQLGERRVRNAEVVGSTPICSTNPNKKLPAWASSLSGTIQ